MLDVLFVVGFIVVVEYFFFYVAKNSQNANGLDNCSFKPSLKFVKLNINIPSDLTRDKAVKFIDGA